MKNRITLHQNDLIFSMINGIIFGLGFSAISQNIAAIPHIPYIISALLFGILATVGVAIGAFLARFYRFFFQLAKFGIVGAANTAVDLGVFNLLIYLNGDNNTAASIALWKALSFIVAVINSYAWNKYWSFAQKNIDKAKAKKEFMQFFGVSIIGWLLNVGITASVIFLFTHSTTPSAVEANIAAAISSLSVLLWNFLGYKLIVFKK